MRKAVGRWPPASFGIPRRDAARAHMRGMILAEQEARIPPRPHPQDPLPTLRR